MTKFLVKVRETTIVSYEVEAETAEKVWDNFWEMDTVELGEELCDSDMLIVEERISEGAKS